jgi:type IV secretion system protein VirB11
MGREEDELEAQRRQSSNLFRDLAPLIPYFDTPTVNNVYVYGSGLVEVDDFDRGAYEPGLSLTVGERLRIIHSLASISDSPIDTWKWPSLETLIRGYNIRTTALLPPAVQAPELTFRRPAQKIHTLAEYVAEGRLSRGDHDKIVGHLERRSNIVVSGSTGSGKTTFVNAILHEMARLTPDERFYIVEDVPELQCSAKKTTQLYVRKEQAVLAIQTALRWTPKRIIFGEVRSGVVANELLEAWNTGHPGNVTTIHANSAASTVSRIQGLLRQVIAGTLPDLSDTVGLIVHLGSRPGFGPYVDEVMALGEIAPQVQAP